MEIKQVSPHDPEVYKMIEMLNQHNLSYYPPELCHLDPPEVLAKDNCVMVGCFDRGNLAGIGAIKFFESYAEVKRMFVPEANRGKGIASAVLAELVIRVKDQNLKYVRLETGKKFTAAMNLYQKHGFEVCEPFGQYLTEPHCTCMEKSLQYNLLGTEN